MAIPVEWPVTAPGGVYDPLDSQSYVIDIYGGHRGSGLNVTLIECMIACEQDETCESFVINEVQQKCLLPLWILGVVLPSGQRHRSLLRGLRERDPADHRRSARATRPSVT